MHVTDRGPANVLMVQNERDVATPLSGALLREALGRRAVMVTNDSTGHDAYLDNGTACGDATVSRFLATGKRPPRTSTASERTFRTGGPARGTPPSVPSASPNAGRRGGP